MEDVFEEMEREEQLRKQEQKMIQLLEQNHYSEKVILKSYRDQLVLHEILVEGRNPEEIGEDLGVSRERVRQIKNRASLWMGHYIYQLENAPPVTEQQDIEPVVVKELGYDIYEVMVWPDESRINEVKEYLLAPLNRFDFSVRAYNCLRAAHIETLSDLFKLESLGELLKHRNFGKKSSVEIEALLIEKGLKFRNEAHSASYQSIKPETKITLPLTYPVENFSWSEEIQQAFKEHHIITVNGLLMARELLLENKNLPTEHFNFIEKRLNEWGLKWKF